MSRSNGRTSRGNGRDGTGRAAALTVRLARAGDLAPLTFFFDAVLRRDYFLPRGQLADMVTDACHGVHVAELDGILVGVAVTTRGSQLVNVLVHPAYRGLGIGRALVGASGASSVRAKLDMASGDPRGFYEALGFRRTGRRNARGNIELMERPKPARANGKVGRTGTNGRCLGSARAAVGRAGRQKARCQR